MARRLVVGAIPRHRGPMAKGTILHRIAARIAFALRLALVGAVLAVSMDPVGMRAEASPAAHCADAHVTDGGVMTGAADRDVVGAVAGCDYACPMHMALLPAVGEGFQHAAPHAPAMRPSRAIAGRAPASPERPPKTISA